MKITIRMLAACLPAIVTGALFAASTGQRADSKPNASATSKAHNALDKLPLSFEPNRGQTDPQVQFVSKGPGYTVYFTKDETVMSLKDTATSDAVVRMRFVGGSNSASAQPVDALPGTSNYMIGNDSSKWLTNVPGYAKLRYENVYPGIDVLYQGDNKQLRYDFIVKPGADASAIRLAFQGADKISVTKDGDLALTIGGKTLVTKKPFTYQEDGGAKKEVASHFVIKDGNVTFELAKYDATKDLVIDPTVVFVTYLGGTVVDIINGVAIVNPILAPGSPASSLFVTGTTSSLNFPGTATAMGKTPVFQTALTGAQNVFVSKISFTGQLVWSTYLGGNSRDFGNGIVVDISAAGCAAGCPVVVGQTFSPNFPTVPFQTPALSGTNDAYAAKLSSDGTALLYSTFLGGLNDDTATGVVINNVTGDVFVGGYTASPMFLGQANAGGTTNSTDAFVVKIPSSYPTTPFSSLKAVLYGGFGEEFARGIAYNQANNMVYLGGDTTTGAQNFIAPNAVNLPGISNNTASQYTVAGAGGGTVTSGLPGPSPNARGGFIVAFEAAGLTRTYASYVAISPAGSTGFESITGIAAEGGCGVATSSTMSPYVTCAAPGNVGHVYITGVTTSHVITSITPTTTTFGTVVAPLYPGAGCTSQIDASSVNPGVAIIGPAGIPIVTQGGFTLPSGCVTAAITQAPFNTNQAVTTGCNFPLPLNFVPTATCNLSAYVGIIDGALLTAPTTAAPLAGNQIEYWAYYSSSNASTVSNAIAIDTNQTAQSFYASSIGTYQQMYITGNTQQTVNAATPCLVGGNAAYSQIANCLPMTNIVANPVTGGSGTSTFLNPSEIFVSYNVGIATNGGGGGVGGYDPYASGYTLPSPCPTPATAGCAIDAYVARFNANAIVASTYGGQGSVGPTGIPNMGYGSNETTPATQPSDHSFLIHTPQFNFGEYIYGEVPTDATSTPNTSGNAIAVDPTRAAFVGGATNVTNSPTGKTCTPSLACNFATTNALQTTNGGGTDGWASVLFFNDIVTDAAAQTTANPWINPATPPGTQQITTGANGSYIESTPAPFGPTFDFAISDPSTQTQTIHVGFTGNPPVLPSWFVPLDPRTGANPPTFDNQLPGSGIAYYVPCAAPFNPAPNAPSGNNAYPAPGGAYAPMTCAFPTNHLYEALPQLFSGWPGLTAAQATGTLVTPGWLLVSQDQQNASVRLQLDRRAAAGLLEGTYVAQFLITTYDSQAGMAQHPNQWPPCGPLSSLNPYAIPAVLPAAGLPCTNAATPPTADNVSVLVTVRLVVRPTLFLSRNSGILTGVTSSLSANPLSGPSTGPASIILSQQQGTSPVPDWLYTGTANDVDAFPGPGVGGVGNLYGAITNVNAGMPTCPGAVGGPLTVPGTTVATVLTILGNPEAMPATVVPVNVPCPIPTMNPPFTGAQWGATAYSGNGPGDFSGGAIPSTPIMTFLYDAGTVQSPNIGVEQALAPTRPDAPGGAAFNADWQGGADPVTQRNDATVHDYYVTAEGSATLSIAAVNCTNFTPTTPGGLVNSNTNVGNWLSVSVGGSSKYLPICTDRTSTNVGTTKLTNGQTAPVTSCPVGCSFTTPISDDSLLPPKVGGQQIALDFLTTAFSNRSIYNGIPTGLYTAQVFVWSTRAKNSVPGYCLGQSAPTSPNGVDGSCTGTGAASSANPNPLVAVTTAQTFTVQLFVFDTTQVVQITPNACPTNGISPGQTIPIIDTIANSENLFTGNITPPYGPGSLPNYPNFGPNGDGTAVWSLTPWTPATPGLLSCTLPPGGQTVPGIGTINNVGPISESSFTASASFLNTNPSGTVTFYACRPTVAPAWLASSSFTEDPTKYPPYPASFQGVKGAVPSLASQVCSINPAGSGGGVQMLGSKVGLIRGNVFNFDSNGNGIGPSPADTADRVDSFTPTGGIQPGDIGIIGDWTGDGHSKAGWFRPATAEWFLNATNSGAAFGAGDIHYGPGSGFGSAGDVPVIGDWAGLGKACIGVVHAGFAWFLDLNCDGVFQPPTGTPVTGDAVFAFGSPGSATIQADVPVVGNWFGRVNAITGRPISQAGGVRPFSSGTVQTSGPALWLLDSGIPGTVAGAVAGGVGSPSAQSTHIIGNAPGVAFGGSMGDQPIVGDWFNIGVTQFGDFAQGFLWVLDAATPTAPQASQSNAFVFPYGGLSVDKPIVGKW